MQIVGCCFLCNGCALYSVVLGSTGLTHIRILHVIHGSL